MMNDDDQKRADLIARAQNARDVVDRVREYYRDMDRADRTPREMMYLHLGLLSGVVMRLLDYPEPGTEKRRPGRPKGQTDRKARRKPGPAETPKADPADGKPEITH